MTEEWSWNPIPADLDDPRIQAAVSELEEMILRQFPGALFEVSCGQQDPYGIFIDVTVDLDDPEPVLDAVIDRLIDMQIKEGLPLHVIPLRTPERNFALFRKHQEERAQRERLAQQAGF